MIQKVSDVTSFHTCNSRTFWKVVLEMQAEGIMCESEYYFLEFFIWGTWAGGKKEIPNLKSVHINFTDTSLVPSYMVTASTLVSGSIKAPCVLFSFTVVYPSPWMIF